MATASQPQLPPPFRPLIRPSADSVVLNPKKSLPPRFHVRLAAKQEFDLEIATQPSLFASAKGRTPKNFYSSRDTAKAAETADVPTDLTGSFNPKSLFEKSAPIPTDAWDKIRQSSPERLYYRVVLRGPKTTTTTEAHTSTTDAEAKTAPWVLVEAGRTRQLLQPLELEANRLRKLHELRINKDGTGLVTDEETSRPFVLCGFNIPGLEYRWPHYGQPRLAANGRPELARSHREAAGFDDRLFKQVAAMKGNIVRVGLNQDWLLNGSTPAANTYDPSGKRSTPRTGADYLVDIDEIVRLASRADQYVLLALQGLALLPKPQTTDEWVVYQPHVPDAMSMVFWAILARRYQNIPSVLFDLCGEPHATTEPPPEKHFASRYRGVWATDRDGWIAVWQETARILIDTIRGNVPEAAQRRPIFVTAISSGPPAPPPSSSSSPPSPMPPSSSPPASSSQSKSPAPRPAPALGWSSSLEGLPTSKLTNVVYCTHFYPQTLLPEAQQRDVATYRKDFADDLIPYANLRRQALGIAIPPSGMSTSDAPTPSTSDAPKPKFLTFVSEWGPMVAETEANKQQAAQKGKKDLLRTDPFVEKCGAAQANTPTWPREDEAYVTDCEEQFASFIKNKAGLVGWTAWGWADDPQLSAARCKTVQTFKVLAWVDQGSGYRVSTWGTFLKERLEKLALPKQVRPGRP